MEKIEKLKNKDVIKIHLFGKEKEVRVFSTGKSRFDENGRYKKYAFDFNEEELNCLNWFLANINIADYKQEIVEYCNSEYAEWSDKKITEEDVENEIDIFAIAINIGSVMQSKDGTLLYPEIVYYGNCKCDEEHGICIGFRDKQFLGISSQDWVL